MKITYKRPVAFEQHPVVQQKYIVPTPSIDAMVTRVEKLIRLRTPGAIIYAHPRFGKTYAIRYVINVLKDLYPQAIFLSFGCQMKKLPSEDSFFTNLLSAVGHEGATVGKASAKRIRLHERLRLLVDKSGYNWVVFFADEAQRLGLIEYEWLRDVHDELERCGIRMLTLLVGQPQLLHQKTGFRVSRQNQIVSRFMIDEIRFSGLLGADDIATCLAGFDEAEYPLDSSWSYTKFFFPKAHAKGLRLVNEADALWTCFNERFQSAGFSYKLEIPMQYFSRAVEICLIENTQFDSETFAFSKAMWQSAINDCNFVAAQEELRVVISDEIDLVGNPKKNNENRP